MNNPDGTVGWRGQAMMCVKL